jgi:hypothetical protein
LPGSPDNPDPGHLRRDLLEQFQQFPAHGVIA